MGLREKVPVAPLDPDRLARVESAVLAEHQREVASLPRQRPRARWVRLAPAMAAACVALLVAGVIGWRLAANRSASDGSEGSTGPVPQVATGPGHTAHLDVGDASVSIGEASRLAVHSFPDGRVTLDLAGGRVECDVTPRPHRPVFVVRAGAVSVTVVGTRFSVERHGEQVDVGVTRGKVRVTRADAGTVFVAAGESWSTAPALASALPAGSGAHHVRATAAGAAAPASHAPAAAPNASGGGPAPAPAPAPGATTATAAIHHGAPAPDHGAGATAGSSPHGTAPPAGHPNAHPPRHHPRIRHVKMPPGLPERTCSSIEDCEHIVVTTGGDEAARALYAWIYLTLAADRPGDALRLTDLYDRRFARRRPTEAAAVDTLRRLARTLASSE